jgi:hypothetical protein
MADMNIKLVAPLEPKTNVEDRSPYLLNVEVLESLKQAIKQAKSTSSMDAKGDLK